MGPGQPKTSTPERSFDAQAPFVGPRFAAFDREAGVSVSPASDACREIRRGRSASPFLQDGAKGIADGGAFPKVASRATQSTTRKRDVPL
jgi:hypothetical protein